MLLNYTHYQQVKENLTVAGKRKKICSKKIEVNLSIHTNPKKA